MMESRNALSSPSPLDLSFRECPGRTRSIGRNKNTRLGKCPVQLEQFRIGFLRLWILLDFDPMSRKLV